MPSLQPGIRTGPLLALLTKSAPDAGIAYSNRQVATCNSCQLTATLGAVLFGIIISTVAPGMRTKPEKNVRTLPWNFGPVGNLQCLCYPYAASACQEVKGAQGGCCIAQPVQVVLGSLQNTGTTAEVMHWLVY